MITPKKALTDTFIKNLKFSTTSKPISDSNGLFILAQKKGKVWIYSYINPKTGKRSTKNRIGYYPQMGLAEARQKRDELNSLVKQGIDPFEYLEKQQREAEQKQETLSGGKYQGNLVAHGLRSIGATYLHERFTTEKEVVEACLSHIDRASVKNRYHRDNGGRLYLDRRREIMQEWADFVEKCKKG